MIAKTLFKQTKNLPCRLIKVKNKAYLERYYAGSFLGLTFFLHRFLSSDGDRFVHDHPWKWAVAFILTGGYREERMRHLDPETGWVSSYHKLFPGKINIIKADDFHRILEPKHETWTLFVHSKRIKNWGFLQFNAEKKEIVYSQTEKEDVKKTRQWHLTAPKGKDIAREPFL